MQLSAEQRAVVVGLLAERFHSVWRRTLHEGGEAIHRLIDDLGDDEYAAAVDYVAGPLIDYMSSLFPVRVVVGGMPYDLFADTGRPVGDLIPAALRAAGLADQQAEGWQIRDAAGHVLAAEARFTECRFPLRLYLYERATTSAAL